jgi:hypothetical protein
MLMLGGIYLCFARISAIDRGLSGVRGLCELIRYTKRQIENYSMPCREIMRGCPREILDLCGYGREMPPEDFLELYYSLEISDSEADRIFFDFANDVGSSYRAEQVKRCEEFLALMSERERYIASRAPIEKKLVLTLSASALIAALILAL